MRTLKNAYWSSKECPKKKTMIDIEAAMNEETINFNSLEEFLKKGISKFEKIILNWLDKRSGDNNNTNNEQQKETEKKENSITEEKPAQTITSTSISTNYDDFPFPPLTREIGNKLKEIHDKIVSDRATVFGIPTVVFFIFFLFYFFPLKANRQCANLF